MINDWRNWEFKNINKIKKKSFGKKFKLIFFFHYNYMSNFKPKVN